MLHSADRCADDNIHVHGDERDAAAGQPADSQHRWEHDVPGHGRRPSQRQLGAQRHSQYAAAEPQAPLRRPQLQAWGGA